METRFKSMFNIFSLMALLVSLLGSAVFVTPVYAAGIVVNSNADVAADDGACTLREAITNANGDSQLYATAGECAAGAGSDTITFMADYVITLSGGQLPAVTTAITINGNGVVNTIVQADAETFKAKNRVFEVGNTGSLTLDALTIQNGQCGNGNSCATFAAGGGGILNQGVLTMTNSLVTGNSSANLAGGIYNIGTLTVSGSTISGNTAFNSNSQGGGIYNTGNLTLTNTTASGNSAGYGGAIYNNSSSLSPFDIVNSTFSGNTSSNYGGAIYIYTGTLTMTNSTISGNSASYSGGGLFNYNGTITLINTTLSNNSASVGGNIYQAPFGIATILKNTIVANSVNSGNCSGAITDGGNNLQYGGTTANSCGMPIATSLTDPLGGNSLTDNGGPTQTVPLPLGSPAIDAGAGCPADDQRGILRPQGAQCDIGAYEYVDVIAPPIVNSITRVNFNPINLASIKFKVTFSEAVTGVDTGDFNLSTSGVSNAIISGISGAGNVYTVTIGTGSGSAGTIHLDLLDNDTILDLASTPLGGAGTGNGDFTGGQSYDIDKTTVVKNANPSGPGSFSQILQYALSGDTITFDASLAGAEISSPVWIFKNITIDGSNLSPHVKFSNNYFNIGSSGSGASGLIVNISGVDFVNGKGLDNYYGNVTISNSSFIGNNLTGTSVYGGAILNEYGSLTVNKSSFIDNHANNGSGGAIYSYQGGVTVTNSTFYKNTANQGGAIVVDISSLSIVNSSFSENAATLGGAIYNTSSYLSLTNSILANSAAPEDCYNTSNMYVNNNSLIETNNGSCGTSAITGDPLFDLPADNGGSTQTMALLPGSPAIDTVNTNCPVADQRGITRPQGTKCDLGAFEVEMAPIVQSVTLANSNHTSAANVGFDVIFSEPVTGVSESDFSLTTNGIAGAFVSGISGSGTTYLVTVATGTGNGSIRLNVLDDDTIIDVFSNPLAAGFTTGNMYDIDRTVSGSNSVWAKSMGGTGNDYGKLALDANGNAYIAGVFLGTMDFDPNAGVVNLTSAGGNDIYLAKLDASGNLLWARRMGGSGSDGAVEIALDPNGNIYMTGNFQGTVDFDPNGGTSNLVSAGSSDVFLARLDSDGNLIWAKSMVGSARDIALNPNGDILITGSFQGVVDFDPGQGVASLDSANGSIFVARWTNDGVFAWAKNMGGASGNGIVLNELAVDTNGNIYMTGYLQGTADFDPGPGTFSLTSMGAEDIFISKLDGSGNFAWAKNMGNNANMAINIGYDIIPDANGNIYITGNFGGTVDFNPDQGTANLTSAGSTDVFILKMDGGGNFVWAKNMGGAGSEIGLCLTLDANGNIYSAGIFGGTADFDPGPGISNMVSAGYSNVFISKLNNDGDFVWAQSMGARSDNSIPNSISPVSITLDSSGNIYTQGYFSGTADFEPGVGKLNLTSFGYADIFISKLANDYIPAIKSIVRTDPDSTSNTSVDFTVTFSKNVTGVDTGDFSLTTSGVSGAAVSGISGTGSVYTVSVSTGIGNGTIRLDVPVSAIITDFDGNPLAGLPYTSGQTYNIQKTAPTATSIVRASASPTSATSVDFTVTFSENVTGVGTGDFSLTTSGVSGAAVSGVSGTGSVYTVTVGTGTGNGTIRLDVPVSATISDAAGNPLTAGFTGGEIYTVIKSATFTDTPLVYWANSYIERLYNAGITGGCGVGTYCPDSSVTRAQMAVFLLKGMHGSSFTPPAINGVTGFTDVATNYWAAAWIKQLAAEGITSGCGNGNYCPETTVTRAQMAIFLLKAKHGSSYNPSNATGVFTDVPVGYWADKWIEQLAAEGVTSGCGNGNYCPDNSVTRAQMAVFLVKAFGLP